MKGNVVRDLIEGLLTQREELRIVAEVHQTGSWNWEKYPLISPDKLLKKSKPYTFKLLVKRKTP